MTEENQEESTGPQDAGKVTSGEMAEALNAIKASSGGLAKALDDAGVTADSLADAHDAATNPASGDG